MDHLEIARMLEARRPQMVEQIVNDLLRHPFWVERFGEGVREKLTVDTDHSLATLIKAVRYRSPMMLDDFVVWLRKILVSLRCSTGHAREPFVRIWALVTSTMPPESHAVIHEYIQGSMQRLTYPQPNVQQVDAVHNELAEDLVAGTFDASWHWQAAYGQEGRQRALYDMWFCVDYLIDALGTNNHDVLARHLRWLRERMLKRGLSTVHLQQLLWVLGETAQRRLPPGVFDEVRHILDNTATLLLFDNESYRAIVAAQEQIVSEVATQLTQAGLSPQPAYAAAEVGWYMAYLGDSVALEDPANFVNYTRWMQHWFASQGLPDTPLRQSYAALDSALERHLPQFAAHEASMVLHAAQSTL